jgi:putative transposase
LSLSAKGLTTGEVSAHLAEVYGASVSKDTISTITDRVLDGMAEWQSRPLDRVYPVIFIDCIHVKIREGNVTNRPIYLALGVTVNGERDILGLWAARSTRPTPRRTASTSTCSTPRGRRGSGP